MMIEGGCWKCGLTTQVFIEGTDINNVYNLESKIICTSCYQKYYSKEAVRNNKIDSLLKPWWKKILKIK